MATRCLIGMEQPRGSVLYAYCHCDGYPDSLGVGRDLLNGLRSPEAVAAIVAGGNMIAVVDGLPKRFEPFSPPVTVDDADAFVAEMEGLNAEYLYLFTRQGDWLCYGHWRGEGDAWRDLREYRERIEADARSPSRPGGPAGGGPGRAGPSAGQRGTGRQGHGAQRQ